MFTSLPDNYCVIVWNWILHGLPLFAVFWVFWQGLALTAYGGWSEHMICIFGLVYCSVCITLQSITVHFCSYTDLVCSFSCLLMIYSLPANSTRNFRWTVWWTSLLVVKVTCLTDYFPNIRFSFLPSRQRLSSVWLGLPLSRIIMLHAMKYY